MPKINPEGGFVSTAFHNIHLGEYYEYVLAYLVIFLLLFTRRCDRPAGIHSSVRVLGFLLCRLQDLHKLRQVTQDHGLINRDEHAWNEHSSVSSTLIIAPALSNSPQ